MSSLVNYISSWWVTPETTVKTGAETTNNLDIPPVPPSTINHVTNDQKNISDGVVYLVSVSDLVSVKLRPVNDTVPAPARNMPHISKFQLTMLNQAQLKSILSVKLKPVVKIQKPVSYLPRHPVLQELLSRRPVVY